MPKTLVITGGNKGIGLDITKYFLKKDYNVVVGARTSMPKNLLTNSNLKFLKTNVINESDHNKLSKLALKHFGYIDVYINNAGVSEWRPIEKIDKKFLDYILDTNLKSYFWGCKVAIKFMNKGGSVINISSIAGKRGSKNNSAYSSSKFGINGLTQSLAKEVGNKKIRVNSICPVLIKTKGLIKALNSKYSPTKGDIESFLKQFAKNQSALNRLPKADEIAKTCYFLASDNSSAITGQSINVDCGVFPQ